ncbi:hypothetical protein DPEC_G00121570 [Dallia pectoralis]|uniref:Uncharacterized protein n=1 Tax=Dallia pectoralis TaxID=75939 RepID=A0ACC2GQ94_DALPE|nr:hypothetical protein DPEC_G00121570 [Dallia pectoralis]
MSQGAVMKRSFTGIMSELHKGSTGGQKVLSCKPISGSIDKCLYRTPNLLCAISLAAAVKKIKNVKKCLFGLLQSITAVFEILSLPACQLAHCEGSLVKYYAWVGQPVTQWEEVFISHSGQGTTAHIPLPSHPWRCRGGRGVEEVGTRMGSKVLGPTALITHDVDVFHSGGLRSPRHSSGSPHCEASVSRRGGDTRVSSSPFKLPTRGGLPPLSSHLHPPPPGPNPASEAAPVFCYLYEA